MSRDGWTFLTNHGHVLVCLAVEPDVLLRDVASSIGITERAVQQIVSDLERAGVIVRLRVGRRNRYILRREEEFRHPVEAGVTIGGFVDLVERGVASRRRTASNRGLTSSLSALDPTGFIDWASEAAQRRLPGR
jgi:DNA-binding Lrp family transcriptional regulator